MPKKPIAHVKKSNSILEHEELSKAFRDMELEFRNEDSNFDQTVFVDGDILDRLTGKGWGFISGRRGTGKTMLLQALKYRVHKENLGFAVYVDLNNCQASIPEAGLSERQRAQEVFNEFIVAMADKMFSDAVDDSSFLRKKIYSSKKNKTAEDIIESIEFEIEIGSDRKTHGGKTKQEERVKQKSAEVQAGLKLNPLAMNLNGSTQASAKGQSQVTELSEFIFTYETKYSNVKKKMIDLINCLEIDTVYILIDEWVSIDRGGAPLVQQMFAEMLRRVFFWLERICN